MTNPLAGYFRKPGIHITLPSGGHYNPEIELEMSGEVAIFPMTGSDEILIQNPDALLNGSALERIVGSCCPAVKNPRKLPLVDVDVIVLAAKLVSYGDDLKMGVTCPHCSTHQQITLSIRALLAEITQLPEQAPVRASDEVVIFMKPYDLQTSNKLNMAQFEESRIIKNLVDDTIEESEKINLLTKSLERIAELNLELLSYCVDKVVIPGQVVTDHKMIHEFINNTDRHIVTKLREKLQELSEFGLKKTTTLTCENVECGKEWETQVVYDPTSFFASGS